MNVRLRTAGLTKLVDELRERPDPECAEGGMTAAPNQIGDGETLTVQIPLRLRKRGGRKLMVAPEGATAWAPQRARVDNAMVKAIARAHPLAANAGERRRTPRSPSSPRPRRSTSPTSAASCG